MQSGKARTKEWFLDYEPEQPREIEPLMGWTASGDMRQQVRLRFDTAEGATAYCERHGIAYQVFNPKPDKPRIIPTLIMAVRKFKTNSTFVDCVTDRSLGTSPLRMRAAHNPTRRYASPRSLP
jgi:hypothetical protein